MVTQITDEICRWLSAPIFIVTLSRYVVSAWPYAEDVSDLLLNVAFPGGQGDRTGNLLLPLGKFLDHRFASNNQVRQLAIKPNPYIICPFFHFFLRDSRRLSVHTEKASFGASSRAGNVWHCLPGVTRQVAAVGVHRRRLFLSLALLRKPGG